MAEETIQSVETQPAPAEVPQFSPAEPASQDKPARQGNGLLIFLTVLLVLVGIADAILWGLVGYCALQSYLNGDGGEPVQIVSSDGGSAQSASGGAADSDDAAEQGVSLNN